ncbi:MAG: GntR family transcriptional regulator [Bacillota bacterium]
MKLDIEDPKEGIYVGDYVYDTIKKNIINFNIKPGNRISEKEISELLKVSRTPAREAFIKLSKEGLLYVLPQRGTYISYIDLEEVEETRFIRESLEKSVIALAVESFPEALLQELEENLKIQRKYIKEKAYDKFLELDEAFHRMIFKGCNKERAWLFMEQINTQYKRVRLLSFIADVNWDKAIDQHGELIEAIREKNKEKAEDVITKHLKKLIVEQIELKQRYPEYFK